MISMLADELRAHLKAALPWISEDFTRKDMCRLRIEAEGRHARLVATNGHALWVSRVELCEEIAAPFVVHLYRNGVELLIKELRFVEGWHRVDVHAERVKVGENEVVGAGFFTPDAAFPPWRQVLPATGIDGRVGCLAANYVADAAASFTEVLKQIQRHQLSGLSAKERRDSTWRVLPGLFLSATGSHEYDPVYVHCPKISTTALLLIMPQASKGWEPLPDVAVFRAA